MEGDPEDSTDSPFIGVALKLPYESETTPLCVTRLKMEMVEKGLETGSVNLFERLCYRKVMKGGHLEMRFKRLERDIERLSHRERLEMDLTKDKNT